MDEIEGWWGKGFMGGMNEKWRKREGKLKLSMVIRN